ncbi:hypothetical protein ACLMAL_03655 [Nocardia sp. CWNU-33]|uniref:hypothetical protein n=1 Tax=Nocardia sp. CWNU-33 TaxID=3392117 RepID=UPI00398F6AB1
MGITANGDVGWYRHDGWIDESATWTGGKGGRRIGSGWQFYTEVFGSYDANGQIYGIAYEGFLDWYRHEGWPDGSPTRVAGDGGRRVGVAFDHFSRVVLGPVVEFA